MKFIANDKSLYLDGGWLCVRSLREPSTLYRELNIDSTIARISKEAQRLRKLRVYKSKLRRALQLVNDVVKAQGFASLGGVWILLGEKLRLAELFYRISNEIAKGTHPAYRAALLVRRKEGTGVLILGTCNFLDLKDVVKVARRLEAEGAASWLGYRPDIFQKHRIKDYIYIVH